MARSAPLNLLFDAHKADPSSDNLNSLLHAVRVRAVNVLQDEDQAQDFLIRLLPDLRELPNGNFAGWIGVRLRWARLNNHRDDTRNKKEVAASYVDMGFDEEGSPMSNEDKLDILNYKDSQHRELPVNLEEIADPTLRKLAELLLMGYTQAEAAEQIGVSLGSIKQRLFRTRQKKLALAA